jgi:hypothetical protein
MNKFDINECIKKLRSDDVLTYEAAFNEIENVITDYKDDILNAMISESNPFIRGKFIELLGLCKDPTFVPILEKELQSSEDDVVSWALSALEMINTKDSIEIAKKYRELYPKWNE